MQGKVTLEDHLATEATLGDSKVFGEHVWHKLGPRLTDVHDTRLREMDRCGIEMMILSLNAPAIQAIHEVKRAIAVARQANDVCAEKQVTEKPCAVVSRIARRMLAHFGMKCNFGDQPSKLLRKPPFPAQTEIHQGHLPPREHRRTTFTSAPRLPCQAFSGGRPVHSMRGQHTTIQHHSDRRFRTLSQVSREPGRIPDRCRRIGPGAPS